MNKIQKYFLMGWIPCVLFMFFNVWSFVTTVSIGYESHPPGFGLAYSTELIVGWGNIIFYLIFVISFTAFVYYCFADKDHPVRLWFARWLDEEEKQRQKFNT